MKVLLKAFGHLECEYDVPDLREKIYLLHRKPYSYKSFDEEYVLPTIPSLQRAVFEYTGHT